MEAVLYVSHGSRVKEGVEQAERFIQTCMELVPVSIQEVCYLELVQPDIERGVRRCIGRGATEIIIQPVLLFAAGHVKEDIPNELQSIRQYYPDITLTYSSPFGTDERIIDILIERIHEQKLPFTKDSMMLLVGRGSRDPDIPEVFVRICQRLNDRGITPIKVCYLAACQPSLNIGLQRAIESDYQQIFVVPYLMFTGVLMNKMREVIQSKKHLNQTFVLCDSFGHHENLIQVLVDRVKENFKTDWESA